jgi:hypothetical protein
MASRLEKSIEEMAEFCPNLTYEPATPPDGGGRWTGVIQPVQGVDELIELLDDIHHNRALRCGKDGELRHLSPCAATHCRHPWMNHIGDLRVPFTVMIHYSGLRDHPRCWILSPQIPPDQRRHFWNDGSICPFLASESIWTWDRHTVADFVPHISVWLVTWLIFSRTGDWIVGEHAATPEYHLAVVKPSDQCWCRSGRKYRKCHMRTDQAAARLSRIHAPIGSTGRR